MTNWDKKVRKNPQCAKINVVCNFNWYFSTSSCILGIWFHNYIRAVYNTICDTGLLLHKNCIDAPQKSGKGKDEFYVLSTSPHERLHKHYKSVTN